VPGHIRAVPGNRLVLSQASPQRQLCAGVGANDAQRAQVAQVPRVDVVPARLILNRKSRVAALARATFQDVNLLISWRPDPGGLAFSFWETPLFSLCERHQRLHNDDRILGRS